MSVSTHTNHSLVASPWLSILIPVYNVREYLHACVESVLNQVQNDPHIEIVLLDDASTDDSASIMHALKSTAPRLKLLRHTYNQGLGRTRNSLLEAATGRYIWFLDSDDELLPGAVDRLRTITVQHAPELVLCDFCVLRPHFSFKHRLRGEAHRTTFSGSSRQLLSSNLAIQGLLETNELHSWSKIATRSLYANDVRFPADCYYEDMGVSLALASRAMHTWYEPQPWIAYRQRPGSILSTLTTAKLADLTFAWRSISSLQGRSEDIDQALALFFMRSYIGAARRIARQQTQAENQDQAYQALNAALTKSLPYTLPTSLKVLLRKGWLWRWQRARYWLAKTHCIEAYPDSLHSPDSNRKFSARR